MIKGAEKWFFRWEVLKTQWVPSIENGRFFKKLIWHYGHNSDLKVSFEAGQINGTTRSKIMISRQYPMYILRTTRIKIKYGKP